MITITTNRKENQRLIIDEDNPRLYLSEWRCQGCQRWINEDDIVWLFEGVTNTDTGSPWCVSCAPEQY